jgi:hypothetical protein
VALATGLRRARRAGVPPYRGAPRQGGNHRQRAMAPAVPWVPSAPLPQRTGDAGARLVLRDTGRGEREREA